jgi:hypothetical protein
MLTIYSDEKFAKAKADIALRRLQKAEKIIISEMAELDKKILEQHKEIIEFINRTRCT